MTNKAKKLHRRCRPTFKNVRVKVYTQEERQFHWFVLPRTHVAHLLKRRIFKNDVSNGEMHIDFWCGKLIHHGRMRFPNRDTDVVCAQCRKEVRDYELNPLIFQD